LLFAYLPDQAALHASEGAPFLPYELIPLATVTVAETILPEARETVQAFLKAGVAVKLFSSGSLEQATATARSLGLATETQTAVSGATFAQLS